MLIRTKVFLENNSQMSRPDSPINLIPEEMLLGIFSFFDTSQLLINSKVCRKWREIFSDKTLWKPILMKRWPTMFQDIQEGYSYLQLYISQMQTISFLSKNEPKLECSFPVENFPAIKMDQNCLDLIRDRFDSKKWYLERGGRIKILSAIRNVDLILLNYRMYYYVNPYGRMVDCNIGSIECCCSILSFYHHPTRTELKSQMVFDNERVTAAIFEFGKLILCRTKANNKKVVSIYNCLPQ